MCYIMLHEAVRINCSDKRNFIPEIKRKTEKGEDVWKAYGYFSTLNLAVEKVIDLKIFSDNVNYQLKGFIDNFKKAKEELIETVVKKIEKELNS